MPSPAEQWIEEELAALERQGLRRTTQPLPATGGRIPGAGPGGAPLLNFASNDYLDLAHHPHVLETAAAALRRYGAGATASRLVSGTLDLHEELEARLAAHKGYPAALVAGSGYLTNTAAVPALVGRGDRILADRLVHASLLDGALQSRADLGRFRHNDPEHLRQLLARPAPTAGGRTLVLVESVYSMDGDVAPLAEIAAATTAAGALLLVDEAHSAGVFGPAGSGLVRGLGLEAAVNLSMSTLSKALGGYGGVIACSRPMRDWLVNRHRGFIYSTAPPPAVLGAALGALDVLAAEPDRGRLLLERAARFRARLRAGGLDTGASASQIIPLMVGDNRRALDLARRLRAQGILAGAIRPPTVPAGTARLRLSVTLAHTEADLEAAAQTILQTFNNG